MTETFEVGKIYFAKQRLDRLYFKVTARTAKTVTVAFLGRQHDVAFKPQQIDEAGNNEVQKIRVRNDDGEEFGYLTVECNLVWLDSHTERIEFSAADKARWLKESLEGIK